MSRPESHTAHEVIKQSTWPYHKELDQLPILKQLMSPDLDEKSYALVIGKMTNWYRHLEPLVFGALAEVAPADIAERHKLPALMIDLQNVSISPEQLSDHASFKISFDTPYEALGALYVMEGGTQGGRFISKNIRDKLQLTAENRFFTVYGDNSDSRWQSFLQHMNLIADSESKQKQLCQGADKVYRSLIDWFSEPQL